MLIIIVAVILALSAFDGDGEEGMLPSSRRNRLAARRRLET
ncbi:hypothetical protein [Natrarchaeobius halalkaliphilus]|nr:hypothetical protein [Natrarchaeobius halalkaliphilus]